MAMLEVRNSNLGSNEQSEKGNPKQCRKGMTLPCTSVYSTPFERIFCAEQFGI